MRLEYLLQGLCYPCTIQWYHDEIDVVSYTGRRKYTFSEINDYIDNLKSEHFVYEFKRISSDTYAIAIV